MPYFRQGVMGGTCIGVYLELINKKLFPPTPLELVDELASIVGSTKIPVVVTFPAETAFRKVLEESGFISYAGKNDVVIHCAAPVVLSKIRMSKYKKVIDAIDRGKNGGLQQGDLALFGTNLETALVGSINMNKKQEVVGVLIQSTKGGRVLSFFGFDANGSPFEYEDTYGWGLDHFMRMVYE